MYKRKVPQGYSGAEEDAPSLTPFGMTQIIAWAFMDSAVIPRPCVAIILPPANPFHSRKADL